MSSVLNHAPSRSRVSSLRAAHLFNSRPWQKGFSHICLSYPFASPPKSIHNAFVRTRSIHSSGGVGSAQPDPQTGSELDEHVLSSDFWSRLRLQSELNRSYHPRDPNHSWPQNNEHSSNPTSCETISSEYIPFESSFSDLTTSDFEHLISTPLTPPKKPVSETEAQRKQPGNEFKNPRRSARANTLSVKPTPTEFLIDTLRNVSQKNSENGRQENWTFAARNPHDPLRTPLTKAQRLSFKATSRKSLQEAVAEYIYDVDRLLDQGSEGGTFKSPDAESEFDASLRRFSRRGLQKYLHRRSYHTTDLTTWAWVLKSSTPYQAVLRIITAENHHRKRNGTTFRIIPPFIPLLLLRQSLDVKSFRLLLLYCLSLISGQPVPKPKAYMIAMSNDVYITKLRPMKGVKPLIDPNMCATFVVRLLHHARQLLPQAQIHIARAFATYLTTLELNGNGVASAATSRNVQLMTQKLNTVLRLLSLPCKSGPFRSASVQQEAQFEILKAMAGNQPALPVTRKGYQGIIAVQLAHKKTYAERQSAELKAPSWPPWREDKLGIDSQRGIEGMKSRAMRVMSQMKEAGYAHSRWEEVSSVYAGWDTDKSPTIQTRILARQPWLLRQPVGDSTHHAIWEARIRTTRTVREAWACFLSYEDLGLPPRACIYAAMAEKLIQRERAVRRKFIQTAHALPGDGLEVFPEPSSARDWIYLPTEPPRLQEFVSQMLAQGIRPSGRFLASLLRSVSSFKTGLEYLSCSSLSNDQVKALCTVWGQESAYGQQSAQALNELPDYLFSAFIFFLCRFSSSGGLLARPGVRTANHSSIIIGHWPRMSIQTTTLFPYSKDLGAFDGFWHPNTLLHAIHLLRVRGSQLPEAWVHVLIAPSKNRLRVLPRHLGGDSRVVLAWYETLEVIGWMKERGIESGLQGFKTLCNCFSKVVEAEFQSPDATEEGLRLVAEAARSGALAHVTPSHPQDLVDNGLRILKDQFDQLVLPDPRTSSLFEINTPSSRSDADPQRTLPRLSHTPSPAVLHAFVRSLGLAEDHDSLLSLLHWMNRYGITIQDASDEYLNGERMMRLTVVAIRVFLEGLLGKESEAPPYWMSSDAQMQEESETWLTSEAAPDDSDGMSLTSQRLQEAYDIVTASDVWGPWPSDEEVQDYCDTHWEGHET